MKNDNLSEIIAADSLKQNNRQLSAIWLISKWSDTVWILEATNDTPRKIRNTWRGVVTIDFNQKLPNGKMLTDPEYSELLEDIKRATYYIREGVYGHEVTRSEGQQTFANNLTSLACFMINEGLDHPSTLLNFSSLNRTHFYDFCILSVEYGSSGVEGHIVRVTSLLDSLSSADLKKVRLTDGSIDRTWLSRKTHIPIKKLSENQKLSLILRKYETCTDYPEYLRDSVSVRREYPSHRETPILQQAKMNLSESRAVEMISIWSYLKRFDEYLIHPLTFDPFLDGGSPASLAKSYGATPKGRTPTIPMDTAMHYLNSAIEWIAVFGTPLVTYKSALDTELKQLTTNKTARKDYYAPQAFANVICPNELQKLNITRYNRHSTGTPIDIRRSQLAVDDAIDCLIAACFILFATFSARRRREITTLRIDSVIAGPDGWDIKFGIQKASAVSRLDRLLRPIPDLLAHAAYLLSNLYTSIRDKDEDQILAKRLFVNANQGNTRDDLTPIENSLIKSIELFADVIEVPLDRNGRRWYLRPHECRRFFAITYYWHRRYQNLDALSWFLGHLDPEETRTYITEAFGQMELDEEERRFTIDAIRQGMHSVELKPITDHISQHFNSTNIEMIESTRLESYINKLIENDCLDIRVRSLSTDANKSELYVEFIEPQSELN